MVYAFVFVGEFGYELFNWQGLVRKFKTTCAKDDKIIIGGRNGMEIWYPYADIFVDISENSFFKMSRADSYVTYDLDSPFKIESLDEIKASVHQQIENYVRSRKLIDENACIEFIFSSDLNVINGIYFVHWAKFRNIYGGVGYKQNLYAKIIYDDDATRKKIEDALNLNLSEPYVLIQDRKRDIVIRSKYVVPIERLIEKLAEKINVVLLNFDTGRAHDSKSELEKIAGCYSIKISSSQEQAILIKYAAECIFPTENDFGSHIYVPPFMGKDVLAIAGADVYRIGTTPTDFWNNNIFRFGGKIFPFVAEEIFQDTESLENFCRIVYQRVAARNFFTRVEDKGRNANFEDYYLWSRTAPPEAHQEKIMQRVGATDYDVTNPRSRTHSLLKFISFLIEKGLITQCFTLADICGGDAVVSEVLKKNFPFAEIIVQDCLKGKFDSHEYASEIGVKIYGGFLQHVVTEDLTLEKLDILMMLNTFRGWESEDLRQHEQNLPSQTFSWLTRNSRFVIVTATQTQITDINSLGYDVADLGDGEDNSRMVCISRGIF